MLLSLSSCSRGDANFSRCSSTSSVGLICFCFYKFLYSPDYIFILTDAHHFGYACSLLPYGIVSEPSSVQGLAADCPILIIFKPSHLILFHICAVVYKALRVFQQLNGFNQVHYCTGEPKIWPGYKMHRITQNTALINVLPIPRLPMNTVVDDQFIITNNIFWNKWRLRCK